uniref:Uncharacterized protein n=1 Tax=Timema genevievae TaxID=629358 RepID=A0A7R9JN40_TIMGE|nr:unnamed protein product [Timema genevievae]
MNTMWVRVARQGSQYILSWEVFWSRSYDELLADTISLVFLLATSLGCSMSLSPTMLLPADATMVSEDSSLERTFFTTRKGKTILEKPPSNASDASFHLTAEVGLIVVDPPESMVKFVGRKESGSYSSTVEILTYSIFPRFRIEPVPCGRSTRDVMIQLPKTHGGNKVDRLVVTSVYLVPPFDLCRQLLYFSIPGIFVIISWAPKAFCMLRH